MSLAENVSARLAYKAYASGLITSNALAVSATDLGTSGGKILRRTTFTTDLGKDSFQSGEIRPDRQVGDMRHGRHIVQGSLMGELSPGTYWDFIEAACRGTEASAVSKSNTQLTSVSATAGAGGAGVGTGTFSFGGGNPITEGFRVGDIVRFGTLSEAANNDTNYLILGFSGTQNRDVLVYPSPTTMLSDSVFTVASIGKTVYVPSSGFVQRKYGFEVYHADLATPAYRLFTECRVSGVKFQLPPTGMATIEIPMMGRWMESAATGSPFFSSPADATTTGITAAVNGLLRVGGESIGVVTGLSIDFEMTATADSVVGQNFVPDIFLGIARVSGQLTGFLQDLTLLNYFRNENEVEILAYLTAASGVAPAAMSIHVPRAKFTDADMGLQGEAGVPISMPFTGIKYETSVATDGIENTTIRFADTEAV